MPQTYERMTSFTQNGWEDYRYWQEQGRKTFKRVNDLIRDIQRDPYEGIGKPEPLRGELSGMWSRRINERDRLIYSIKDEGITIHAMYGHYDD